ncbi:hypothetical protein HGO38_02190 [Rhizobium sp. CG5]|uniref:hypothetical protein n=1 Tax=Rhizobium sp. CG5 TaxID=2726076 RepID=UPI0020334173|nr:hypothetical protein [Rhizobium sp. CG5]MCM2472283.1 hypothetical protein [Rhizobium sp. CG5]
MSEFRLSFPACVIAGKNRLNADDVILLRKYTFPYGIQTSVDVVTMLALNNSCPEKCEEWSTFFVETLTHYIVHQCYPQGTLDDINAGWIRLMFTTDGVINSPLELELVLHIIEVASRVPASLSVLALDQVRLALSNGMGAYHLIRGHRGARMLAGDLNYVLRVLRGGCGPDIGALSPEQASAIQRIDRAAVHGSSHPDWHAFTASLGTLAPQPVEPVRSRWLRVSDAFLLDEAAA